MRAYWHDVQLLVLQQSVIHALQNECFLPYVESAQNIYHVEVQLFTLQAQFCQWSSLFAKRWARRQLLHWFDLRRKGH